MVLLNFWDTWWTPLPTDLAIEWSVASRASSTYVLTARTWCFSNRLLAFGSVCVQLFDACLSQPPFSPFLPFAISGLTGSTCFCWLGFFRCVLLAGKSLSMFSLPRKHSSGSTTQHNTLVLLPFSTRPKPSLLKPPWDLQTHEIVVMYETA